MSEKKTEISEIKIKVAGKELNLTPAEARDLRKILDDLFGENRAQYHYYQWTPPYRYGTWQIQWDSTAMTTRGANYLLTTSSR